MLSKRLGMTLISLALSLCLMGGATFTLFTANSASAENTLVAGTFALGTPSSTVTNVNNTFTPVTVTLGVPVNTLVNIANIAPGDSATAGTFQVIYTGNVAAWLGVTATSSGAIFAGATPLTVTVWESANAYPADGLRHAVGTTPVSTGTSKTFTVKYALPIAADNSYQGATGSVDLIIDAVADGTAPPPPPPPPAHGAIVGRVCSPPSPGATVSGAGPGGKTTSTFIKANGFLGQWRAYSLRDVVAGKWVLTLKAPGADPVSLAVVVPAGGTVAAADFSLACTGESGRPYYALGLLLTLAGIVLWAPWRRKDEEPCA